MFALRLAADGSDALMIEEATGASVASALCCRDWQLRTVAMEVLETNVLRLPGYARCAQETGAGLVCIRWHGWVWWQAGERVWGGAYAMWRLLRARADRRSRCCLSGTPRSCCGRWLLLPGAA